MEAIIERIKKSRNGVLDNETIEEIITDLKEQLKVIFDKYYYLRGIKVRSRKSYQDDRKSQYLRHIAKILFIEVNESLNLLKPNMEDQILVEVQTMLARDIRGVRKLYVSFNTQQQYESSSDVIMNIKNKLEDLLHKEKLVQRIRLASKPSKRDQLELTFNYKHFLYKLNLYRDICKELFGLLEKQAFIAASCDLECGVEIVMPLLDNFQRHAEENLCDKAIHLMKGQKEKGIIEFQIRGRKRPCKSCVGRIESCGIKAIYNERSGFFFMDCLREQLRSCDISAVVKSLEILQKDLCYRSEKTNDDTDCFGRDTDSDSDYMVDDDDDCKTVTGQEFDNDFEEEHFKKEKNNNRRRSCSKEREMNWEEKSLNKRKSKEKKERKRLNSDNNSITN